MQAEGYLAHDIEEAFEHASQKGHRDEDRRLFDRFIHSLNAGDIRAAEPDPASPNGWRVNEWVKKGILLGFKLGTQREYEGNVEDQHFYDKSTYPLKRLTIQNGVRLVPGGSSIRTGVFVAENVTCMPPMYINVGAYIDEGTMIDSHALVGSCAQVGKRCHISAGAQLGGVLEPVGAMPVIIEDDAMIGGLCGVFEGTIVKKGAVLGSGTILNRSTPVYDIPNGRMITAPDDKPLVIPENAVVVPGARPVSSGQGKEWGISLYAPVIVKYRDDSTGSRVQLEEMLR